MTQIKINNRIIGHGCQPFIIAEAGINHNGEIETAFKMIEAAKKAQVDAIKFQTFKPEELILDPNQTYTYKSQGKEITESMLKMYSRYELSQNDWVKIKKKCDKEKIMFLSTPQNKTDLDLLIEIGIPAIKIGSDDFNNLPLLKDYASTGLPLILSCGMADLSEIFVSLNTVGALNGYPTILLYTTSLYPTPPKEVNLLKITTLRSIFPQIPIGFSDHTQGTLASSLAVALGACLFEKHFTLDHNMPGPDHWFSEDPVGLREWSNTIKQAYKMTGNSILRHTKIEEQNRKQLRRFIVAIKGIKQGEIFTIENIGMRRIMQERGLPPSMYEMILGKKSTKNYTKGEPLQL